MDCTNLLMEEPDKEMSENAMQSSDDEYNSDNEEFYFESDHLPLRGNSDYRVVLRAIVILEAQRIEAAKHIDNISGAQKKALQDPEQFLKKLTSTEGLELPGAINIQNVSKSKPTISFYVQHLIDFIDNFRCLKLDSKNITCPMKRIIQVQRKRKQKKRMTLQYEEEFSIKQNLKHLIK